MEGAVIFLSAIKNINIRNDEHLFESIRKVLLHKKCLLNSYPFQAVDLRIDNYMCVKASLVKSIRNISASIISLIEDEEVERFLQDFKSKLKHIPNFQSGIIRLCFYTVNGEYTYKSFTFAKEKYLSQNDFLKSTSRIIEKDLALFKEDICKTLIQAMTKDFRADIGKRKCSTLILHTRNCLPQRLIWSVSVNDADPDLSANNNINATFDLEQAETLGDLLRIRMSNIRLQHIGTIMLRFAWTDNKTCRMNIEVHDNFHYYGATDLFPVDNMILVQ